MPTKRVLRVLVADDDADIREFVETVLAEEQFAATFAADGRQALEFLEASEFDLLLTDIRMPIMDGIALALAAKRDYPDLTILLMTGFADQRERAKGLQAIVADVLTKPFSLADLRATVARVLGGQARI